MTTQEIMVKEEGDNPFIRICKEFSIKKGGLWMILIFFCFYIFMANINL